MFLYIWQDLFFYNKTANHVVFASPEGRSDKDECSEIRIDKKQEKKRYVL